MQDLRVTYLGCQPEEATEQQRIGNGNESVRHGVGSHQTSCAI